MGGRWTALGLALVLSLALTSCGAKEEREPETGRLSSRGISGTQSSAGAERDLLEDGRYYAGTDGRVSWRAGGESEWEKLSRELRESWDNMMDGAQDAARETEQAARAGERGT